MSGKAVAVRFIVRKDVPKKDKNGEPWFSLVTRRAHQFGISGEGDEYEEYRVVHPDSLEDLKEIARGIFGKDVTIIVYKE